MATNDRGLINPGDQQLATVRRRRFVELLLGAGFLATAAAFIYPVVRYLVPPKTSDLGSDAVVAGKVGELKPNSGKIFRFGSRPGLLIRTADGGYRAMSATCTHLSCTVQYREKICARSGVLATTASTTSMAGIFLVPRLVLWKPSMCRSVAMRSS